MYIKLSSDDLGIFTEGTIGCIKEKINHKAIVVQLSEPIQSKIWPENARKDLIILSPRHVGVDFHDFQKDPIFVSYAHPVYRNKTFGDREFTKDAQTIVFFNLELR